MLRFKRFLRFKSINLSPFFINQLIRIVLMLLVFILLPSLNNLQLANTLDSTKEQVVVEIASPTPSPSSLYIKKKLVADGSANKVLDLSQDKPRVEVGSKSLSSICKDEKEPWKLVPNPQSDGQYLICNAAKTEPMAAADELNTAQNAYRGGH